MFAGTDADNILDRLDPNLAVSNGTGAGGVADDVDNAIDMFISADKGELHLRDRVDKQLVAAHVFLPAMLCAAALHLVDSHAANISSKQRVFKNLELLSTNDCRDLLYSEFLSLRVGLTERLKLLVQTTKRRIGALTVLARIQAQCLVGLVHAQDTVEQRLDHRGDQQIEHQHNSDRHHNA